MRTILYQHGVEKNGLKKEKVINFFDVFFDEGGKKCQKAQNEG